MHRVRLTRYRRAERLDVFDARHPLHALVVVGKCQPQVDAVAGDVAGDDGMTVSDRLVATAGSKCRTADCDGQAPFEAGP